MPLARAPRHRSGCRAPARRRRDARPRVRTLRLARRTPRPSTGRTRRPTRVPDGMLPPEGVGERLAVATCCHRRRTPRGYIANRAYGRWPNLPAGTAKPEGERNEASPLELRSVKRPEATRVRRYLRRAEPALAGRTRAAEPGGRMAETTGIPAGSLDAFFTPGTVGPLLNSRRQTTQLRHELIVICHLY